VILLPVATRYEQEGGGTSTTTERRVAFSPEILRPPGEARSEWRLYGDVVRATRPDLARAFAWPDNRSLRAEIARVIPSYAGIEDLRDTGDAIQWGGRHLCAGGRFPTPSGRARFTVLDSPLPPDLARFTVGTRRGKQFNSMIWEDVDPLTGAPRDAIFIDRADAASLGLGDGARVRLESSAGEYVGRLRCVDLPTRTLQVHWPEGNVLISGAPSHREPGSSIPDYNATVTLTPAP
jgi:predicted molibdopterin-dependent oxidoreductase YjgC